MTASENDTVELTTAGRRRPRATVRRIAVVMVPLLVGGLAVVAAGGGLGSLRLASDICPEAGTVPAGDQQLLDDAEALACVSEPETTTSTTLPGVETTTSTTLPVRTTTTVPTVESLTGTLRGTKDSIDVAVTVHPLDLKAADILTLDVHATDTKGGELVIGIYWGQAEQPGGAPGPPELLCAPATAGGGSPRSTEATRTLQHAYRKPGRYNFAVIVAAGYCEGSNELEVTGTAVVGPGPLLANGPLTPKMGAFASQAGDATTANLGIQALEPDGYIDRIEVNWGDGSPAHVVTYPMDKCRDPLTVFPTTGRHEQVGHRYATPGTHQATVTVRSVGCDGSNPQTVTKTAALQQP